MSRLMWDADGARLYESGVNQVALFPKTGSNGVYGTGVAWNGVTSISETPSGGEPTALYADNAKYLTLMSVEELGGTIEAYMHPDEFAACDGSASLETGVVIGQQTRKEFGLAYKTAIGNDVDGTDHGYKLHLIYNALAKPSEHQYSTINDSPEASTMSWEYSTTPVQIDGYKPASRILVISTKATGAKMKALEDIIYGIPTPEFNAASTYAVGDYVAYTDKVYKCKTAVTAPGAWSAASWTEVPNPGPRMPMPSEVISLMSGI